jgi:hypothetical protein
VEDIASHPIELENVVESWLGGLRGRLGLGWQAEGFDEAEVRRAETLVKSRYACENWTKNRSRAMLESQEIL